MHYIQIIILAVVQGLTEFLPVSSSGHLILVPKLFNFEDQGLVLDSILHLATLLAIITFFRKDLSKLLSGLLNPQSDPSSHRLARNILLASIPAGIAGFFWGDVIETQLRSPHFVAFNLLFWSAVFLLADRVASQRKERENGFQKLGLGNVLFVGAAQVMALFPGTSRSGITIAAGLFSKLTHTAAARLSFLLGTPIIFLAGMHQLQAFLFMPDGEFVFSAAQLMVGFAVTFIVGYLSIDVLLKILARNGFLPFIFYRVILALAIFAFF